MSERDIRYSLDPSGRYVVENYNWAVPFSNFFPGIAGKWGIPLWTYWVSRAQGVCSVGVRDKDHQILEFQSFNRACQLVPHEGFRSFIRVAGGAPIELFQRTRRPVRQRLLMSIGELELEEADAETGIETKVVYFPLVNLPVAGLVRKLTLTNSTASPKQIQLLDGLPRVLPYGMDQGHIKQSARHVEAMMGVAHRRGVPLFRLKQTASDREQVEELSGGNFYLGLDDGGLVSHYVVDPQVIFDDPMQHLEPWGFQRLSLEELFAREQLFENITPCAFSGLEASLEPGASVSLVTLLGNVESDERLETLLKQVRTSGFLDGKRHENTELMAEITGKAFTCSAQPVFDRYTGQDFLDNVMRGGMPVSFEADGKQSTFYAYSRQNGDLERDYHYFVLEPTYLSQGTGHYRSIYQNRRTDSWFFPEIGDTNIVWFMSLLQLDGYNPLEVRGLSYTAADIGAVERALTSVVSDHGSVEHLLELVRGAFTPGQLVMRIEELRGSALPDREDLLGKVLTACEENELGGLHEGFWVDHWYYNLDTIDVFLMVYPDRLRELLLAEGKYTFFDDPDVVLPRSEKSVLRPDGQVRRYGAVHRDPEKLELIQSRAANQFRMRSEHGRGEIYRTNLLVKLLCLLANRIATLDPSGVGIEMEADKPGWNDSMNGLPGLFGSSLCETLELHKLCRFLDRSVDELGDFSVPVYEELVDLVLALDAALERRTAGGAFAFWDESNQHKERYRERTRLGVSGAEKPVDAATLRGFVGRCRKLLDALFEGPDRQAVFSDDGVPYTYFVNEVESYEATGGKSPQGYPLVRPTAFRQRPVRLFLEGPMHYLKVHPEQAREVYQAVRKSALYDEKLGMYRSCENMTGESFELGRAVGAYPRGWLENESIYLHMEYKYLLEVLHSGLYDEFYEDIQSALVPFMDPEAYGRSTLEGASFIVSSAYADPALHGRGFQPRLSGITVEMLHLWILMVAGPAPLTLDDDGRLALGLRPALAGWLFTGEPTTRSYVDDKRGRLELTLPANSFAFKLFGSTLVVYHNADRKNTYGPGGVKPTEHTLTLRDGSQRVESGPRLGTELALAVREGRVERIDVTLSR